LGKIGEKLKTIEGRTRKKMRKKKKNQEYENRLRKKIIKWAIFMTYIMSCEEFSGQGTLRGV